LKKRIPYGIGDFELIRSKNMYYVDKTRMIKDLELHQCPFFIRPRRFGKSLLISTLEGYYDVANKERFDELFKGLWIHGNPTPERNSYLILRLDFSGIETSYGKEKLYESFTHKVKEDSVSFLNRYSNHVNLKTIEKIEKTEDPSAIMKTLCNHTRETKKQNLPPDRRIRQLCQRPNRGTSG